MYKHIIKTTALLLHVRRSERSGARAVIICSHGRICETVIFVKKLFATQVVYHHKELSVEACSSKSTPFRNCRLQTLAVCVCALRGARIPSICEIWAPMMLETIAAAVFVSMKLLQCMHMNLDPGEDASDESSMGAEPRLKTHFWTESRAQACYHEKLLTVQYRWCPRIQASVLVTCQCTYHIMVETCIFEIFEPPIQTILLQAASCIHVYTVVRTHPSAGNHGEEKLFWRVGYKTKAPHTQSW